MISFPVLRVAAIGSLLLFALGANLRLRRMARSRAAGGGATLAPLEAAALWTAGPLCSHSTLLVPRVPRSGEPPVVVSFGLAHGEKPAGTLKARLVRVSDADHARASFALPLIELAPHGAGYQARFELAPPDGYGLLANQTPSRADRRALDWAGAVFGGVMAVWALASSRQAEAAERARSSQGHWHVQIDEIERGHLVTRSTFDLALAMTIEDMPPLGVVAAQATAAAPRFIWRLVRARLVLLLLLPPQADPWAELRARFSKALHRPSRNLIGVALSALGIFSYGACLTIDHAYHFAHGRLTEAVVDSVKPLDTIKGKPQGYQLYLHYPPGPMASDGSSTEAVEKVSEEEGQGLLPGVHRAIRCDPADPSRVVSTYDLRMDLSALLLGAMLIAMVTFGIAVGVT